MYNRRLKTFHDVHLGLYLVCSVHSSSCFIHPDKPQLHKHCLDYTYSYFFQTSFKEAGSALALERINVRVRKNSCKLNFYILFSIYFVRNNEDIHLPFKNSEK